MQKYHIADYVYDIEDTDWEYNPYQDEYMDTYQEPECDRQGEEI